MKCSLLKSSKSSKVPSNTSLEGRLKLGSLPGDCIDRT